MNLNLLPAFLKSALHFITGLQLRIKEHTDFQNRSWINRKPARNLKMDGLTEESRAKT